MKKSFFLVPHAWGVDIPAMLMAASERKIAVMFQSGSGVCLEQRSSSFRKNITRS